jgi:molybdopterin converting factor small subunit
VRLFGALRDLAAGPELALEVPHGITVAALRRRLREALGGGLPSPAQDALVESSALAGDDGILPEWQALRPGSVEVELALLPPVCGG